MPENRLDHLIHAGVPPENRLAHPEKARPGNHNSPDIVELGRATRWQPGQSGNPGGRPKRTPFANACREVGELTDFEDKPGDPGHLRLAKALMRHALSERMGSVHAASELMDRAEGRPAQTIVQQSD